MNPSTVMLTWLRTLLGGAPASPPLVLTAEGFQLHHSAGTITVAWKDIDQILAYKRDRITTDEIMLQVSVHGVAQPIPVSEEWRGFPDFLETMGKELGIGTRWYIDIITPAFAPTP